MINFEKYEHSSIKIISKTQKSLINKIYKIINLQLTMEWANIDKTFLSSNELNLG